MAIDQRPDLFLPGPPPVLEETPAARPTRHPAPLRPMDRAWLLTWRQELDPDLHASLPASTMVGVAALARPELLLEVEAYAAIGRG